MSQSQPPLHMLIQRLKLLLQHHKKKHNRDTKQEEQNREQEPEQKKEPRARTEKKKPRERKRQRKSQSEREKKNELERKREIVTRGFRSEGVQMIFIVELDLILVNPRGRRQFVEPRKYILCLSSSSSSSSIFSVISLHDCVVNFSFSLFDLGCETHNIYLLYFFF